MLIYMKHDYNGDTRFRSVGIILYMSGRKHDDSTIEKAHLYIKCSVYLGETSTGGKQGQNNDYKVLGL